MDEQETARGARSRHNERINALIAALVDTFGPDACDVPEAQIENAVNEDACVTRMAVWVRLCVPPGCG